MTYGLSDVPVQIGVSYRIPGKYFYSGNGDLAISLSAPSDEKFHAVTGRIAWLHEPEAVTHMKARQGHATLKKLAVALGHFDVFDEPLPNGGYRTLYRPKADGNVKTFGESL